MLLASPLLAVYLARRLFIGKSREGWRERLGCLPDSLRRTHGPRIWIHAASVGEVMAAVPVIKRVHERLQDHEIVVSTITPGGYETASKQVGDLVSAVVYLPFDVPFAVRRALRMIGPSVVAIFETELWPNLLCLAKMSGARILLLNGRISDRSIHRYERVKWLFAWVLGHFDCILAQSERDRKRFERIGGDPARISVAGNTKFDEITQELNDAEIVKLRQELRMPVGAPVWVAGSTRSAEEEDLVLGAFLIVRQVIPELALILAPRHIDRAGDVGARMRDAGLSPVLKTELIDFDGKVRELVLDTFGELARVYAVADVAFIGNSLVAPGGGQNLLQPLAHGKPVIHGPYMSNFRDIAAIASDAGVSTCVRDSKELAEEVIRIVRDVRARAAIREKALSMVSEYRGAASRQAEAIIALAGKGPSNTLDADLLRRALR